MSENNENQIHWKDVDNHMAVGKRDDGNYYANSMKVYYEERNETIAKWRMERYTEMTNLKVANINQGC
jgi:hypothetical protein